MEDDKRSLEQMNGLIRAYIEDLRAKGLAENTILSYERDLRKFAAYCQARGVWETDQLTEALLRAFLDDLGGEGHQKPATVARCLSSVRLFIRCLLEKGLISQDFTARIRGPKAERDLPYILSQEEVEALLLQPQGPGPKTQRDRAILELLYATGIRVSELVQLKLSDVNLGLEYIMCQQKHQGRVIPFGKSAKSALEQYLLEARPEIVKEKDCDFFFTNMRGQQLTRQGLWKLLKKYGKDAGIQGEITPHTLRHSFAAHLIQNGADLFAVQEMMGYSNLAGTQMYEKMRPGSIREAYTKAKLR